MRAALVQAWPTLSRVYGLHPWHVDPARPALTLGEIDAYLDDSKAR